MQCDINQCHRIRLAVLQRFIIKNIGKPIYKTRKDSYTNDLGRRNCHAKNQKQHDRHRNSSQIVPIGISIFIRYILINRNFIENIIKSPQKRGEDGERNPGEHEKDLDA